MGTSIEILSPLGVPDLCTWHVKEAADDVQGNVVCNPVSGNAIASRLGDGRFAGGGCCGNPRASRSLQEEVPHWGKLAARPHQALHCLSFFFFFNLFIYLWLCWVFVSVRALSPVAASGGLSSSRCAGLSLLQPLVAEHRLQTRRLSSCGSRA